MTDLKPPIQDSAQDALPIVVWLEHADDLRDEFSMDADDVMQELGIKRSRLTQISGRELRVGRLRIDKYTKPFYRPCDVAAYKSWTRATASHQSSAEAINSALAKLDQQVIDLNHFVAPPLAELKTELATLLAQGFGRSFRQQQHHFLGAMDLLCKIVGRLEGSLGHERSRGEKLISLAASCKEIADELNHGGDAARTTLKELTQKLDLIHGEIDLKGDETRELMAQLRLELIGVRDALGNGMEHLAKSGEDLRQDLATMFEHHLSGPWEKAIEERMAAHKADILTEMQRMAEKERDARHERDERILIQTGMLHAGMMDAMARCEEQSQSQRELLEQLLSAQKDGARQDCVEPKETLLFQEEGWMEYP